MKLKILPEKEQIDFKEGALLLDLVKSIDAGCGGKGLCGQCRVQVRKGEVVEKSISPKLSNEERSRGWRLACQCLAKTDLEIFVPETSRIEQSFFAQKIHAPSGQFLTEQEIAGLNQGWRAEPLVPKFYLELPPPSKEDSCSDQERLLAALRQKYGVNNVEFVFPVLRGLPAALRRNNFKLTASLAKTDGRGEGESPRRWQLIRIEPGDRTSRNFALAFDIGTTTISGEMIELASGKTLAAMTDFNEQKIYGADVINRILAADKPRGLLQLQAAVIKTVNQVIDKLLAKTRVSREEISYLTLAGNTVMTHLLLGLDPRWIRLSPYTPAAKIFPPVPAKELGIKMGEWPRVYAMPCVASYVGGDIVAGVLATGIYKRPELTLYIDIGTNGEIVLGNKDWMLAASCSAGPAFEGGGIEFGINARPGAIERFRIDKDKQSARWQAIGNKKPLGICGSGAINITAELFRSGLLDKNGKINSERGSPLVRQGKNGLEVLIAESAETAIGKDIVFTASDLQNLVLAKAAMFAGYRTLLGHAGLKFQNLAQVLIAGNFGSYLDIENAVFIGLLPDIDRAKIKFIGNGSLLGARLIALSEQLKNDAEKIAGLINNIELSDSSAFHDEFRGAQFLPHTDEKLFPTVMERINRPERTAERDQGSKQAPAKSPPLTGGDKGEGD